LRRAFADVDLDLADVDFLSSAGLSALLTGQKHLLEHDCRLRLVDVQEAVRNVLDLAGFGELFEIIDRQDLEYGLMVSGWGPACMPY
jgi:anti-anti-sigma factor